MAICCLDEHTSHLLGRVKVPHLLHHGRVAVSDAFVVTAPCTQQHQQGTLCAVAHKLYGVLDDQKRLAEKAVSGEAENAILPLCHSLTPVILRLHIDDSLDR